MGDTGRAHRTVRALSDANTRLRSKVSSLEEDLKTAQSSLKTSVSNSWESPEVCCSVEVDRVEGYEATFKEQLYPGGDWAKTAFLLHMCL